MGLAGGLVPSPSALVVLIGAIALHRAWFGVVLVVFYGAGMAVTLVGIGLCFPGFAAGSSGASSPEACCPGRSACFPSRRRC